MVFRGTVPISRLSSFPRRTGTNIDICFLTFSSLYPQFAFDKCVRHGDKKLAKFLETTDFLWKKTCAYHRARLTCFYYGQ